MSTTKPLVIRADDIEPFTHPAEPHYHSQHILGRETSGNHDLLLNRGTVEAGHGLGGGNHPDNDEIYYIVSGRSLLDLGGDRDSGEGAQTYQMEPGTVVFIPKGTFHRLRDAEASEDLVLLTIWPEEAPRGANGIHDLRLDTWGTGFRLRDGLRLESDTVGARVVDIRSGNDPRIS